MHFYGNRAVFYVVFGLFLLLQHSCTIVKEFPEGQPFVYDNKINLTGNLDKDENKRLTTELENYWDDSLYARKVQQFGVRFVLKNPPAFDTVNISRTQTFIRGYLNSQGYYNAIFTNTDSCFRFDTVVKHNKTQIRTTITLDIDPGKSTIIDSFSYELNDQWLDSIAHGSFNNSFIKPGKTAFSKQVIASELDRIVSLFRDFGYYYLTRENLVAEVDTTDIALISLTNDPFEQAMKIVEAAERRKQHPTCIVVFKKRSQLDSTVLDSDTLYFRKYYNGDIFFYPETGRYQQPDSIMVDTPNYEQFRQEYYTVYSQKNLFRFRPLKEHSFQRKGNFYSDFSLYKTLNNFNSIGAWERIDYRTEIREDTVDFHYFLTPAKKQTLSFNLETSRNTGDFLSSSSLIGIALNTNYTNRNVWRSAIQSNTLFSNGIEFSLDKNNSFLQSFQSALSQIYSVPRLIVPFHINTIKLDNIRTNISMSAAYSDRKDYFRLRSLVSGWGYQWKKRNIIWQYKPINIELYTLDTLALLDSAIKDNPFLRTSFNDGSVISQQLSLNFTYPGKKGNVSNYIRLAAEEAGAIFGRFKGLQDKIYQYIKFEAEYRRLTTFRKSAVAVRAFGGIGYNYGQNEKFGKTLPFFKQFIAGGPNSMRAWGLRLLGLGSSVVSDTAEDYRDRYADMQLEANAEYRFTLAQFSSVKIGSALFVDAGNIWNLYKNEEAPNSEFSLQRLGKDIAIGIGTGLRFDFTYFMIRVDMGIKLKDPARSANNGWLDFSDFTWKNYEYSVKNPETGDYSPATRNNYAVQLGIGLPF